MRGRRLGLTQRLDLPAPEHAQEAVSALFPSLTAESPDVVILSGFEEKVGQSLPALEAMTGALQSHDIEIQDRIIVRNGRWRSLDCYDPNCCPVQGSPVPEPADVPRDRRGVHRLWRPPLPGQRSPGQTAQGRTLVRGRR